MYCPKCGKPVDDDALFCSSCGHALKKENEKKLVENCNCNYGNCSCGVGDLFCIDF